MLVMHERHENSKMRPKRNTDNDPRPPPNPRRHQFAMLPGPCLPISHSPLTFPKTAILLDSGSSISIFADLSLLTNVRPADPPITLHTSGGEHVARQIGEYHGLGRALTVWADPTSIINILSLHDVRQVAQVTMDTDIAPAFIVHLPDQAPIRFLEQTSGLYLYDPNHNNDRPLVNPYSCLQTVSGNRKLFSRRKVEGADAACSRTLPSHRPSFSHKIHGVCDQGRV